MLLFLLYMTVAVDDSVVGSWPWWWILSVFVPGVNLILSIWVGIELARFFGRGVWFGLGLALLSPIFIPILGFGNAQYVNHQSGKHLE
jgi:hypothetical protein